jgi:hypothetical protein
LQGRISVHVPQVYIAGVGIFPTDALQIRSSPPLPYTCAVPSAFLPVAAALPGDGLDGHLECNGD